MIKLPEKLHYIYDPNWFPQNSVNITEIPSETIQKLPINHQNIEIRNYTKITNTNTSVEVPPIENMDTIIHSQQSGNRMHETTETDFNSTLLDDGALFSSHTVNTLIDLEKDQNNNQNNNNNKIIIILLLIPLLARIFTKITNTDKL